MTFNNSANSIVSIRHLSFIQTYAHIGQSIEVYIYHSKCDVRDIMSALEMDRCVCLCAVRAVYRMRLGQLI